MTDRPTTPPPGEPEPQRPEQVAPAAPPPTGGPPPTAALPPTGAPPPPTAALPPTAPPPYAAAAPARGAPSGPRRLWGEATSTGGGRAALVVAAILGTLLLVTGVGLVAALVWDDDWGRDERVGMSERWGPGNGNGNGKGLGQGKRNGDRNGMGNGMGQGRGNQGEGDLDDPPGLGRGRGGDGGALGGDVLHGEFTTGVTGTPTVMVIQTGVVTAYTAGDSITVESADGFRATYSLDGAIATPRSVPVATGTQVRVVAAKAGMTVTRLVVLE